MRHSSVKLLFLAGLAQLCPAQPRSVVYVGTSSGLYSSLDGGETWERNAALGERPVYLVSLPGGDSTLQLVSTTQGVLQSINGGVSWEASDLPLGVGPRVIVASAARPERVYALASWRSIENRLWISNDAGKHWSQAAGAPQGFLDLTVDPADASVVYAAAAIPFRPYEQPTGGVYRSIDAGETWTLLDATSSFSLGLSDDRTTLYRAGVGGLSKSTDAGRSWQPFNPTEPVGTLVPRPSGAEDTPMVDSYGSPFMFRSLRAQRSTLYACLSVLWFSFGPDDIEASAIVKWADGHWQSLPLRAPAFCETVGVASDPAALDTVYSGGAFFLQRTLDGGQTWTAVPMFNGLHVYSVAIANGKPPNTEPRGQARAQ